MPSGRDREADAKAEPSMTPKSTADGRAARKGKDQGRAAVADAARGISLGAGRGRARSGSPGRDRVGAGGGAAMPTIWRVQRSSACASTVMVLRARPKWPASPTCPTNARPGESRRRELVSRSGIAAGCGCAGASAAAAAGHGLDCHLPASPMSGRRQAALRGQCRDPRRPTPPAEIPVSRPLDLRADVAEPSVRERTRPLPRRALDGEVAVPCRAAEIIYLA